MFARDPTNLKGSILCGTSMRDSTEAKAYVLGPIVKRGVLSYDYICTDINDIPRTQYVCRVLSKDGFSKTTGNKLAKWMKDFQQLNHPNILGLHDLLEDEFFVYIILPYMEGGDLFDKISKSKSFSEAQARRIIVQVARGLEYLHSRGMCHGEIKPENILCSSDDDDDFQVKLADCGFSAVIANQMLLKTVCVSLNFIPPEVLCFTQRYSQASDVWSFGVLAYALLTGCYAFTASNDVELACAIKNGIYNKANLESRGVSPAARAFIERILVVDPSERPTVTQLLEDPWLTGINEPDVDLTDSRDAIRHTWLSVPDECDENNGSDYSNFDEFVDGFHDDFDCFMA